MDLTIFGLVALLLLGANVQLVFLLGTIYFLAIIMTNDEGNYEKTDKGKVGTVIAIDLGTMYSSVGVFKSGRVEMIRNEQGNHITPSYVAFTAEGERLVGDAAKNQLTINPENTVFGAKRLIGRAWSDSTVQHDIKSFPFEVIEKNFKPHIRISTKQGNKVFAPEEISAMIMRKLKEIAEAYLGEKVTHAVILVPAYFNNAQRQATKDAGSIAGLNVIRIINEPTAVAIAHRMNKKDEEKYVLVFNLGGGSFDVSLLSIDNGVFEVLATYGDTHLGGEDFDRRVIDHFIELYKNQKSKDISKDNCAIQKLRCEVEKAKRALSVNHRVQIEIESFFEGNYFSETLTREKFEELNTDLFHNTMQPVRKVLEDADMEAKDVGEIVLVGGSTRIPKVQTLVKEFFNGKELSLINRDGAAAYGAAVQAGILSGEQDIEVIKLLDVNPLSLGVGTIGGVMSTLIPRNTKIPTKKSGMYTTALDNQDNIAILIYEGERRMVKNNRLLGKFVLTGIQLAPKGIPKIEETIEIDADGILHISAEDKSTGNHQKLVIINNKSQLTHEDIECMIKDADQFANQDNEIVKAIKEFKSYAYSLEKQVQGNYMRGFKLSVKEKTELEKAIVEKLNWLCQIRDAELEDYKRQMKELQNVEHKIIAKR